MEIDPVLLKEINETAQPYVEFIFTTYLVPKIDQYIIKSKNRAKNKQNIQRNIVDYILTSYQEASIIHTLAFRNQDKKLDDIYQRLTIRLDATGEEIIVDNEYLYSCEKMLIVDSAGMGKSVLSKRIVLNCINNKKGMPILIELRNFNIDKNINEYIFNILKFEGKVDNDILADLPYLIIFDGFDEVLPENHEKLISKINDFSKLYSEIPIIITSREESILSKLVDFKRYHIKELQLEEAFELLKKYSQEESFTKKMIQAINAERGSVGEFLGTPLYVSLLFCAYMYKHDIPLKRHLFYSQVFDALYSGHDLTKSQGFSRPKKSNLDSGELHTVLRHIAYKSLQKGMVIDYPSDELRIVIDNIKTNLPQLKFNSSDFITDLLSSVPLFLREGPCIKWNHKSLMEYFAARFICHDIGDNRNLVIKHIFQSTKLNSYINLLSLIADIDYRFFRNQVLLDLLKDLLEHIKRSKEQITNRRIKSTDIDYRACLTYCRDVTIYIGNVKKKKELVYDPKDKKNYVNSIFKMMAEGTNSTERMHGSFGFFDCPVFIGMNEDTKREILSIGLRKEREYFSYKNLENPNKTYLKKTTIPIEKLLPIDCDKNNVINNSANFSIVNLIISQSEIRNIFFIDERSLVSIIDSIENDSISDADNLLAGI